MEDWLVSRKISRPWIKYGSHRPLRVWSYVKHSILTYMNENNTTSQFCMNPKFMYKSFVEVIYQWRPLSKNEIGELYDVCLSISEIFSTNEFDFILVSLHPWSIWILNNNNKNWWTLKLKWFFYVLTIFRLNLIWIYFKKSLSQFEESALMN